MFTQNHIRALSQKTDSKIIMLVLDGLGGLPDTTGKTELETAFTPNLDRLAGESVCGLSIPVNYGITPGSAPGHTALFGYDPLQVNIGRGVLEAVGIDFPIEPGDVIARGNFCTVDDHGLITDQRAGRISTEINTRLCHILKMTIEDVQIITTPVKEHRFVVVFRAQGLASNVTESDPQQTGKPPLTVMALTDSAAKTARIANAFLTRAQEILSREQPANMLLLRGFSQKPDLPSMQEIYKLSPAAIAVYPMYRGLARLVGMEIIKTGTTFQDEIVTLRENYDRHDFFFVHVKQLDAAGEDGDFSRKVKGIEDIDRLIPEIMSLQPDVLIVTADHSTPAILKGHSWHPVPTMIYSAHCRPDQTNSFSESTCLQGGLGIFPASQIMQLAMANALKLQKYGA